jgi:hypothetical protein
MAEERRGGVNPSFGFAEKNVVPKTYNGSGAVIPKKESPPKIHKAPEPPAPPAKKVTTHVPTNRVDTGSRQGTRKVERK